MNEVFRVLKKFIIAILLVVIVGLSIVVIKEKIYIHAKNNEPVAITKDIQGSINDIGELATAEYIYTINQLAKKPSKKIIGFEIPFTSSQVLYSYDGVVKAGIEFNKTEIIVNDDEKTIFVELPKAKILTSEVYFESLVVYDSNYSPFNNFKFEDMNLSLIDLKKVANEKATKNGVIDKATENAKNIIAVTINGLYGNDEYKVEFY